MNRLREILKDQIEWYKEKKKLEKSGEIDDSYIYDCLIDEFSSLRRGDYVDIIETLINDEEF